MCADVFDNRKRKRKEYVYNDELIVEEESETPSQNRAYLFSGEDEFIEKLIKVVKLHPYLYNRTLYRTQKRIRKSWSTVARHLHTTVDKCKERWTYIRMFYTRLLKTERLRLAQGFPKLRAEPPWRFYKDLKFLTPHIREYKTRRYNFDQNSTSDEECDIQSQPATSKIQSVCETIEIDDDEDDDIKGPVKNENTQIQKVEESAENNLESIKIADVRCVQENKCDELKNVNSQVDNESKESVVTEIVLDDDNIENIEQQELGGNDTKVDVQNKLFEGNNRISVDEIQSGDSCYSNNINEDANESCCSMDRDALGDGFPCDASGKRSMIKDKLVIEAVKRHPILYSVRARLARYRSERREAWADVSQRVGVKVSSCKVWWGYKKNQFHKLLEMQQWRSIHNEEELKRTQWFASLMKFYLPHMNAPMEYESRLEKLLNHSISRSSDDDSNEPTQAPVVVQEEDLTWSDQEAEDFVLKEYINNVLKTKEKRQVNKSAIDVEDELSCYTNFFS